MSIAVLLSRSFDDDPDLRDRLRARLETELGMRAAGLNPRWRHAVAGSGSQQDERRSDVVLLLVATGQTRWSEPGTVRHLDEIAERGTPAFVCVRGSLDLSHELAATHHQAFRENALWVPLLDEDDASCTRILDAVADRMLLGGHPLGLPDDRSDGLSQWLTELDLLRAEGPWSGGGQSGIPVDREVDAVVQLLKAGEYGLARTRLEDNGDQQAWTALYLQGRLRLLQAMGEVERAVHHLELALVLADGSDLRSRLRREACLRQLAKARRWATMSTHDAARADSWLGDLERSLEQNSGADSWTASTRAWIEDERIRLLGRQGPERQRDTAAGLVKLLGGRPEQAVVLADSQDLADVRPAVLGDIRDRAGQHLNRLHDRLGGRPPDLRRADLVEMMGGCRDYAAQVADELRRQFELVANLLHGLQGHPRWETDVRDEELAVAEAASNEARRQREGAIGDMATVALRAGWPRNKDDAAVLSAVSDKPIDTAGLDEEIALKRRRRDDLEAHIHDTTRRIDRVGDPTWPDPRPASISGGVVLGFVLLAVVTVLANDPWWSTAAFILSAIVALVVGFRELVVRAIRRAPLRRRLARDRAELHGLGVEAADLDHLRLGREEVERLTETSTQLDDEVVQSRDKRAQARAAADAAAEGFHQPGASPSELAAALVGRLGTFHAVTAEWPRFWFAEAIASAQAHQLTWIDGSQSNGGLLAGRASRRLVRRTADGRTSDLAAVFPADEISRALAIEHALLQLGV